VEWSQCAGVNTVWATLLFGMKFNIFLEGCKTNNFGKLEKGEEYIRAKYMHEKRNASEAYLS
jgi:hypothetical protein